MKNITIRVWNGEKMIYDVITIKDGVAMLYYEDSDGSVAFTPMSGKLKFMENVGVKDCNNKEMYEGDILVDIDDDGMKWVVCWGEEECAFVLDGIDAPDMMCDWCIQEGMTVEYEIIGNIYEDFELLGNDSKV